MAIYSIKTIQLVPTRLDNAWDFFSSPLNLKILTPPSLALKVLPSTFKDKIYAGQVIEYTVRPIFNIPLYWMTEITHVVPGQYFVDEQRFGPYSFWHHQHHFAPVAGGVEMTDIVHYKIPLWGLGVLAQKLFVRRQLEGIFRFRREKVEEIFGVWKG